jgi:Protein of unknown function (DUF3306)
LADPGDFLARWSRLKRKAQAEPREAAIRSGTARHRVAEAEPQAAPSAAAPAAKPDEELPRIETLGKDSDYTPFMRADVPDGLRNEALRKLWQSDPVFANLDGLVDYAEDFGAAFAVGGTVATVYRVLQGMPDPADEKEPEPAVEPAAEPPAAAADPALSTPEIAPTSAALQARDGHGIVESDEHLELE